MSLRPKQKINIYWKRISFIIQLRFFVAKTRIFNTHTLLLIVIISNWYHPIKDSNFIWNNLFGLTILKIFGWFIHGFLYWVELIGSLSSLYTFFFLLSCGALWICNEVIFIKLKQTFSSKATAAAREAREGKSRETIKITIKRAANSPKRREISGMWKNN